MNFLKQVTGSDLTTLVNYSTCKKIDFRTQQEANCLVFRVKGRHLQLEKKLQTT